MDLYFLNFQRILVVLTSKAMRLAILREIEEKQIDVNIKFADSYFQAANLMQQNQFDPYDHIVLNLSFSNTKFKDFLEYIKPHMKTKKNFLIEYREGQDLCFPQESSHE